MTRVYYKEAVGAFLVFDVSRPPTFEAILKWKHDLDTKVCLPDGSPIPCLLLANKVCIYESIHEIVSRWKYEIVSRSKHQIVAYF